MGADTPTLHLQGWHARFRTLGIPAIVDVSAPWSGPWGGGKRKTKAEAHLKCFPSFGDPGDPSWLWSLPSRPPRSPPGQCPPLRSWKEPGGKEAKSICKQCVRRVSCAQQGFAKSRSVGGGLANWVWGPSPHQAVSQALGGKVGGDMACNSVRFVQLPPLSPYLQKEGSFPPFLEIRGKRRGHPAPHQSCPHSSKPPSPCFYVSWYPQTPGRVASSPQLPHTHTNKSTI